VEGYRAYANHATPDGKINPWSLQVRWAVESDPYSLCIASPLTLSPEMKELAVQSHEGGRFVTRSLETVRDRSYPLYNQIFFYLNRAPGKPADPKVEEFLRFVLSQEGQEQVQREGRYLPLTSEVAKAQLAKLDASSK
jgi:phosphate transport system substrate-binding protein